MKIYVDVNTTKNDYMAFQRRHTYRSLWVYALIALLAVLLFVLLIQNKNSTGQINAGILLGFIAVCAVFLYILANNVIKATAAALKEEKKPNFLYTFTKGSVHCESGGRSFDLPWNKIYAVKEEKSMFLIYVNKQSALIIPKRCFANADDIDEFSKNLLFEPKKVVKNQINNSK